MLERCDLCFDDFVHKMAGFTVAALEKWGNNRKNVKSTTNFSHCF